VRRAEQQRVGDLRQRRIECHRLAQLVHQTQPQRVVGGDALARESITPERPMSDGADHERHDAERRHADPQLRNREERRAGGDRHVAAGDEPRAATDRAAFDHGDSGFGQAVENREHVAYRIFGGLRLGLRARPARGEVGTGAEMSAGAAQNHDPHAVIRAQRLELVAQLIEHGLVERIAALRPVERHGRDAPGRKFDRNRLQRHVQPPCIPRVRRLRAAPANL
jgi:hypothetical protein